MKVMSSLPALSMSEPMLGDAARPFANAEEAASASHAEDVSSERFIERALIERATSGDEHALATLYARHAPRVHRFLRDLLGDATNAADATQETFARAFRRLDTLKDADRVAPWLFGIARNVSLEQRRAKRRSGKVFSAGELLPEEAPSTSRTPEAELIDREALESLSRALGELSEDRRAMLLLRLDHGLAYEDIAKTMGFTLAKVKVEIHRARLELRAAMEDKRKDGGRR